MKKTAQILKIVLLAGLISFSGGCFLNDGPYPAAPKEEDPVPTLSPPAILSFSADLETITLGESATLSWEIENASQVTIEPGIGEVQAKASLTVSPTETTTYVLTAASGETEPVQARFTVEVDPAPVDPSPPADPCASAPQTAGMLSQQVRFWASKPNVLAGEGALISWSFTAVSPEHSVQLSLAGQPLSNMVSGQISVTPGQTADYVLRVEQCGIATQRTLTLKKLTWAQEAVENVSKIHASPLGRVLWAGKQDGTLHQSQDYGTSWTQVAPARPNKIALNQNQELIGWDGNAVSGTVANLPNGKKEISFADASPVSAVLELASGCPGMLFYGTKTGFVYRSADGGSTLNGFNASGDAVNFLYTYRPNEPDRIYSSPVRFFVQDPADPKVIYVGDAGGLLRLGACDAAAAAAFEDIDGTRGNYNFQGTDVKGGAAYKDKTYVANRDGLRWSQDGRNWTRVEAIGAPVAWLRVSGNSLKAGTATDIWSYNGQDWSHESLENSEDVFTAPDLSFVLQSGRLLYRRPADSGWSTALEPEGQGVESASVLIRFMNHKTLLLTGEGGIYSLTLPVSIRQPSDQLRQRLGEFRLNRELLP